MIPFEIKSFIEYEKQRYPWPHPVWYPPNIYYMSSTMSQTSNFCSTTPVNLITENSCNVVSNEGITVKGSEVNQNFSYGHHNQLEETSRVIILKLVGIKESGKIIEKPLTVNTKKVCSTCGKKSRSDLKFCSKCGTFLE